MAVSPVAGSFLVQYQCLSDAFRASCDGRLVSFELQGFSEVLRSVYDLDWIAAGGVVGSYEYDNALLAMLSEIVTIDPPQGTPYEVVTTPTPQIAARYDAWTSVYLQPLDCFIIKGK